MYWLHWCTDILMYWHTDVLTLLMYWHTDVLTLLMYWLCWCTDTLMYWHTDVLTCWCTDILMYWHTTTLLFGPLLLLTHQYHYGWYDYECLTSGCLGDAHWIQMDGEQSQRAGGWQSDSPVCIWRGNRYVHGNVSTWGHDSHILVVHGM